jgi:uncharacterized membrane protein YciS (DUF1049 family)
MFTKLKLIGPLAFAMLGFIAASIEPAAAFHLIDRAEATPVPGPIIGAGLPVLAVLGGGYWLVRKLRGR